MIVLETGYLPWYQKFFLKHHQHTFNRLTISSLLILSVISFTPGGYITFPSPAGFCCCANSMLTDVWSTRSSTGLYGSEIKSSTQPCYRTYQKHRYKHHCRVPITTFNRQNVQDDTYILGDFSRLCFSERKPPLNHVNSSYATSPQLNNNCTSSVNPSENND